MKELTKKELVKQIRKMIKSTQDNIIKLIIDNKFIYSDEKIADKVLELRCTDYWADKPTSDFFKTLNKISYYPESAMKEIVNIIFDENLGYRDADLSKHFLSSQEQQYVIDKSDNEIKKHEKKLKKQKELYDLIMTKGKELSSLRNEYIKCGGSRCV